MPNGNEKNSIRRKLGVSSLERSAAFLGGGGKLPVPPRKGRRAKRLWDEGGAETYREKRT